MNPEKSFFFLKSVLVLVLALVLAFLLLLVLLLLCRGCRFAA